MTPSPQYQSSHRKQAYPSKPNACRKNALKDKDVALCSSGDQGGRINEKSSDVEAATLSNSSKRFQSSKQPKLNEMKEGMHDGTYNVVSKQTSTQKVNVHNNNVIRPPSRNLGPTSNETSKTPCEGRKGIVSSTKPIKPSLCTNNVNYSKDMSDAQLEEAMSTEEGKTKNEYAVAESTELNTAENTTMIRSDTFEIYQNTKTIDHIADGRKNKTENSNSKISAAITEDFKETDDHHESAVFKSAKKHRNSEGAASHHRRSRSSLRGRHKHHVRQVQDSGVEIRPEGEEEVSGWPENDKFQNAATPDRASVVTFNTKYRAGSTGMKCNRSRAPSVGDTDTGLVKPQKRNSSIEPMLSYQVLKDARNSTKKSKREPMEPENETMVLNSDITGAPKYRMGAQIQTYVDIKTLEGQHIGVQGVRKANAATERDVCYFDSKSCDEGESESVAKSERKICDRKSLSPASARVTKENKSWRQVSSEPYDGKRYGSYESRRHDYSDFKRAEGSADESNVREADSSKLIGRKMRKDRSTPKGELQCARTRTSSLDEQEKGMYKYKEKKRTRSKDKKPQHSRDELCEECSTDVGRFEKKPPHSSERRQPKTNRRERSISDQKIKDYKRRSRERSASPTGSISSYQEKITWNDMIENSSIQNSDYVESPGSSCQRPHLSRRHNSDTQLETFAEQSSADTRAADSDLHFDKILRRRNRRSPFCSHEGRSKSRSRSSKKSLHEWSYSDASLYPDAVKTLGPGGSETTIDKDIRLSTRPALSVSRKRSISRQRFTTKHDKQTMTPRHASACSRMIHTNDDASLRHFDKMLSEDYAQRFAKDKATSIKQWLETTSISRLSGSDFEEFALGSLITRSDTNFKTGYANMSTDIKRPKIVQNDTRNISPVNARSQRMYTRPASAPRAPLIPVNTPLFKEAPRNPRWPMSEAKPRLHTRRLIRGNEPDSPKKVAALAAAGHKAYQRNESLGSGRLRGISQYKGMCMRGFIGFCIILVVFEAVAIIIALLWNDQTMAKVYTDWVEPISQTKPPVVDSPVHQLIEDSVDDSIKEINITGAQQI